MFLLFGLGLFYTGWLFFGILILLLGVRHPPPLNDVSPLDTKRYLVGAFVVAVLLTGFVVVPIATPPGTVSLETGTIGYPTPTLLHPVQATVNYTVVNGDPVRHGYLVQASVANVSQRQGNSTVYLQGAALYNWEANATWTFFLPNGVIASLNGGSVTLPNYDYLTIDGSAALPLTLAFADTGPATSVLLNLQALQLCAPSNGGVATNSVELVPP